MKSGQRLWWMAVHFTCIPKYVIQTEPPAGTLPDTTEEETPTDTATKKRCREGKEDRYA